MTDTDDANHDGSVPDASANNADAGKKKKPYVKPSFRYERVFVTTALSCGKISSTEVNCVHNTKAS
jgi:hypothetical protein